MAAQVIGDGGSDGVKLQNTTTATIGFFGVTPIAQYTTFSAVSTTASTTTSPAGYSTTTQADAIVSNVNSIRTILRAFGLVA